MGRKITVLLVDDDRLVRETLSGGLKRLGYNVIEASSPSEAIDFVSNPKRTIEWVVTDHMMPDINGIELGARLRRLRPSLSMLLISGFAEVLDEGIATKNGFASVLMKPVTPIQLHETIKSLTRD